MTRALASLALLGALAGLLSLPKGCSDRQSSRSFVAGPGTISGHVRVIDGDTLVLVNTNTHVRLNGVDAPEVVHPGYDRDDPFGPESRDEMRRIVGDQVVRCELTGGKSYERLVGICFLPDGTDVGAEIIRRGLALDCFRFSRGRYHELEPAGVRELIHAAPYCG